MSSTHRSPCSTPAPHAPTTQGVRRRPAVRHNVWCTDNAHYVNRHDEAPLPQDVIVRRHMKKLARRYGYVRKVSVWRNTVDMETGELTARKRRVNRKTKWMNGQAGFISLPDGVRSGYELGRLLEYYNQLYAKTTSAPKPQEGGYGPQGSLRGHEPWMDDPEAFRAA